MTRSRRARLRRMLVGVAVLATVQFVIVLAYLRGEGRQTGGQATGAFPVERVGRVLDADADALVLERQDRSGWKIAELRGRPIVLHFWATWCRPCRDELPTLLAQAPRIRRAGAELALVSVDEDWSEIRQFFGGTVPAEVSRAVNTGYRQMTTGMLPETLIVDASGVLAIRVRGARDWRSASALTFLDSLEWPHD